MPTADHNQLDHYHLQQLHFDLSKDSLSPPLIPIEPDYDSRRMSSHSAASTTETDSSRGEKRSLTPGDSPLPKKQRSDEEWEEQKPSIDAGVDHSKVQLPSIFTTFEDNYRDGRRASLPVLHSESRVRHAPYPPTSLRQNYTPTNQSNLSSYTFPPNDDSDRRPRVSTDLAFNGNAYDLSNGTTPSSSSFSYSPDIRTPGMSPYSESDNWNNSSANGIVRPSSTPGQLSNQAVKYDDGLRHASFSAPMSQAHLFAGSARISGQHDRRSLSGIKSDWSFPNQDFVLPSGNHYSPSLGPATPNISVASPGRSPQSMPSSALVDRPTRKRGKLPKETTDFLKAWLHRHSDHPYPSEEEKKQLCHATGLSMSQVSNWMINARRRILAPAHRAASGPTTTAPFPPSGRSGSLSGLLDPIGRRASMPSADTLQLYHPMTLQSMPNSPNGHHHGHHSDYTSRHGQHGHIVGMSSSRSSHLGGVNDYGSSGRQMGMYQQSTNSSGHSPPHYLSSDVPLSAPPSLSNNPFSSHNNSSGQGGVYSSLLPSPRSSAQQAYYNDAPSH
ncbi:hypothetical protein D9613_006010 [Agrocybe pediades]|uniref:Homeobox domain-containing protein n=1 Tax=Agrocybe pediades TaxID=84607 RepID=A0A8H4VNR7_9AGAR|nr:hypothetical protein D9613_006010 [Agrocybe pediades]KAF9561335.1 hypothetical protein CPC08DRAFT_762166 [Agrocybe pediades]